MIEVITKTGFKTKVPKNVMNDMEVVDAIVLSESENELERMKAVSVLSKKLFGKDLKKLYEHLRTEDGRVPADAIELEVVDVFESFGKEAKN